MVNYIKSNRLEDLKRSFDLARTNPRRTRSILDAAFALHLAIENGNKEMVEWLVNTCEVDVTKSKDGITPAISCILKDLNEMLEIILATSSRTRVGDVVWSRRGRQGNTIVHYAAFYNSMKCMPGVLQCASSLVNAVNEETYTPLIIAAWKGHRELAKMLIKTGADVKAAAADGNTGQKIWLWLIRVDLLFLISIACSDEIRTF